MTPQETKMLAQKLEFFGEQLTEVKDELKRNNTHLLELIKEVRFEAKADNIRSEDLISGRLDKHGSRITEIGDDVSTMKGIYKGVSIALGTVGALLVFALKELKDKFF